MKTARIFAAWITVFAIALLSFTTARAAVDPITITVTFNKEELSINEEITATYSITGGSGTYTSMRASWEGESGGCIIYYDGINLEKESGTVSFTTDEKNEKVRLYISADDSDKKYGFVFSDWIPVVGAKPTSPIVITVMLNKEELSINEEITATYSITGGSGTYTSMRASWEGESGGCIIYYDGINLEKESGTVSFTTDEKNEKVRLYISADDSDKKYGFIFSDWIPVKPQEIVLENNPTSMKSGETILLNPSINDGTKDTFTYSSSDLTILSVDSSGLVTAGLNEGQATITITADNNGLKKEISIAVISADREPLIGNIDGPTYMISNGYSISFTATASGGKGPYKYKFILLRNDTPISDFETDSGTASFSGQGVSILGIYTGQVIIEDALGQTITKDSTDYVQLTANSILMGSRYPKKTGWTETEAGWSYVKEDGTKAIGWLNDGDAWYYMNAEGIMQTGWVSDGNNWYYLRENGTMATGWISVGGTWYYMQPNGIMATGWLNDGGIWYYMKENGAMATGWVDDGGTWYWMGTDGTMKIGWVNLGGAWYYMSPGGAMATGWQQIGGSWYYFDGSGAMATGLQEIGARYCFSGDGFMLTGWQQVGGAWYYFRPDGCGATGWQLIESVWYYFGGDGVMATGWQQIGGAWYYFGGDGVMATGWKEINGQWELFADSGAWLYTWQGN